MPSLRPELASEPTANRAMARAVKSVLRRMSIARKGLKHAHAIAFGVKEGDVLADARYLHRLAQHLAAGIGHFLHRGRDVIDRDDDGRMLRRPVGPFREEATIDRAWLLGAAPVGFGRRDEDIVAHLFPKHLHPPAERALVELRHALAVVVGHFEVNDRVHFAHDGPPYRWLLGQRWRADPSILPLARATWASRQSRVCVKPRSIPSSISCPHRSQGVGPLLHGGAARQTPTAAAITPLEHVASFP